MTTAPITTNVKPLLNFLIDHARLATENREIQEGLEVLEQRAKEILAHAKTGLLCEHRADKDYAVLRITQLVDDMRDVAKGLRKELEIE